MKPTGMRYEANWILLLRGLIFVVVTATALTQLGAQVVNSTLNPLQVATLHWYGANQTTQFTVGNFPAGVVFDGANIWVANLAGNTVTKLRANDGTNLGSFAAGTGPYALAYDGANVWAADGGSNTVTKIRASNGVTVGTFTVGSSPSAIVFDGANIWVANAGSNT